MINVSIPQLEADMKPRITVFGVGGAGGNAVNNMIKSNLEGVDFVVGNTDAQALQGSLCERRLQLGTNLTRGLGAGSKPDVGHAAAEEQIEEIVSYLEGSNMVFITAGMGGGTGTGAAPVIARAARERNILTVGVVTKPFHFEGGNRMKLAEAGIAELQQYVDTLIIIPNQNLFRIANEKTTFADAFKMADDVLHSGVRGVTDLMVMPGLINLDFADIRSVMTEMGKAMMGTGEASGDRRAIEAAEAAISNPLLDDVSMRGARGVLINITGGYDMTLFEVDEAAHKVREEVDPEANIIFGSTFDSSMEGTMRVSVVATGIESAAMAHHRPTQAPTLQVVGGGQPTGAPIGGVPRKPTAVPGLSAAAPVMAPAPALSPVVAQPTAAPAAMAGLTAQAAAPQTAAPATPMAMTQGANALRIDPAPREIEAEAASAPVVNEAAASVGQAPALPPVTKPLSGPPQAERRDDRFVAPRPMDAGPRAPVSAPSSAEPEIAEAPERRRLSLFERVTGIGRRREEAPAPAAAPTHAESSPRQTASDAAPVRQGQLDIGGHQGGLQGGNHQLMAGGKAHAGDDDALDIPAFLRRQAN